MGDHQRRRDLMDAASGVTRAAVVLYACIPPDRDEDAILTKARAYAAARDWTILEEVVDSVPLHIPMGRRVEWPRVQDLIDCGQAAGIVTPSRTMCGYYADERHHLDEWIADRRAFVAAVTLPDPAAPDRAR